jgi:hypothetical protein
VRIAVVPAIVFLTVAPGADLGAADPTPRLSYAIEDQFGETHTEAECRGAVALVLGGGRKGVEFVDHWGPALHRELARELDEGLVCSVGFAHLKGAPFFVKKKIVDSFPKDPGAWTLLDWKGHFARTWGAEKDAANLYLFDSGGRLVLHESLREIDSETLHRIVESARAAVVDR